MLLSNGTIILNRYEVLQALGEGGMGAVYRVRQLDADRVIALKLLHSISLNDDDSIKRFHREAKALAHLKHEHIVNFLHFGFLEDGAPFAALEYLPGKNLAATMQEEHVSIARSIKIIKQVLEALTVSHAEGIVHRDLKPANIILLPEPEPDFVKIVDFGLAKLVSGKESAKLTSTGLLIGSVHYMSPEQSRGQVVDARSDLYSVSCILYELLTGQKPFDADSPVGILYKQANEDAPSFSSTPFGAQCGKSLEFICNKGMQKNPANRYQSAAEMLKDLDLWEVGKGEAIAGAAASKPLPIKSLQRIAVVLIVLVGLILLAGVAYKSLHKENANTAITIQSKAERRAQVLDREISRLRKTLQGYRKELPLAKSDDEKREAYTHIVYQLCWVARVETDAGLYADARKKLDEAYELCDKLGELRLSERARVLVLRGRCHLMASEYEDSEKDFQEAKSLVVQEFGKTSKAVQDLVLHRLLLKAHLRKFAEVSDDLLMLKEAWTVDSATNPKTATGRYQAITMGGPQRVDLLLESVHVLIQSPEGKSDENVARLRALISAMKLLEISDYPSEVKCLKMILPALKSHPSDDPEVARLERELQSLPAAKNAG